MTKTKLAAGLLIGLMILVLGFYFLSPKTKNDRIINAVQNGQTIAQTSSTGEESTSIEATNDSSVMDMVSVGAPFTTDTEYNTKFTTANDDKYDSIVAVSDYDFTGNHLSMIGDMSDLLTDTNLHFNDNLPYTVVQNYHLKNDAIVDLATSGSNFTSTTWKKTPPAELTAKAGQTVMITYTTTDRGESWSADYRIFNSVNS